MTRIKKYQLSIIYNITCICNVGYLGIYDIFKFFHESGQNFINSIKLFVPQIQNVLHNFIVLQINNVLQKI